MSTSTKASTQAIDLARPTGDPLKDHFTHFLAAVWMHLGLGKPTRRQLAVAKWLQYGPRRSITGGFRGLGKSWITVSFVLWILYRDPQRRVLVVSASKIHADNFSTFAKQLIHSMPLLAHLQAEPGQRDALDKFDVGPAEPDLAPSIKSVGIKGQITGSRADLIVADDVEVPSNSLTEHMRAQLREAVKEFDAVLKPGGIVRYLGTPQTEMSLYNELQDRGYAIRLWPVRYPDARLRAIYGDRLAPDVTSELEAGARVGSTTEPERFSDTDLMEREASYGRSGFSLQFMLDTTVSDANRYPLKLHDLIVMGLDADKAPQELAWSGDRSSTINDLESLGLKGDRWQGPGWVDRDAQWLPYELTEMAIDPSGRGADETSYAVVSTLHGRVFLRAAGGYAGGFDADTLKGLAAVARAHRVSRITIESNFGDGMFAALFRPVLEQVWPHCTLEEVRSSTQKEVRIIETLEPLMNQHRLVVDRRVVERDWQVAQQDKQLSLFYQMTRLTKERGALAHDDKVDALALVVKAVQRQVGLDPGQAVERARQEARERLVEEFIEEFDGLVARRAGGRRKRENWIGNLLH